MTIAGTANPKGTQLIGPSRALDVSHHNSQLNHDEGDVSLKKKLFKKMLSKNQDEHRGKVTEK